MVVLTLHVLFLTSNEQKRVLMEIQQNYQYNQIT